MQSFRASKLLRPGFFAVEALSDVDRAGIVNRLDASDQPRSLRTNHRQVDDDRARPTFQCRDRPRSRAASNLVEAREVAVNFQAMIRRQAPAELDPWIEPAKTPIGTERGPETGVRLNVDYQVWSI